MCTTEIALMIGGDGATVAISEPATVVVFRREDGQWHRNRELPFSLDENGGLAGLRRRSADLIEFLSGCTTLVARSAGGAVFFELEKARFAVFELHGRPEELLDEVWRELRKEQETATPLPAGADIPAPLEIAPGRYTISITEIQGKRPEISSKQVLRQFVQKGAFSELEITCDHIPPWIEVDAERCGYDLTSSRSGLHELKVLLRKTAGGCC